MSLSTETKLEVQRLIRTGNKIQAIKLLTEVLGVSLIQAKDLVEAAERETGNQDHAEIQNTTATTSGDLTDNIKSLLEAGQKILAVKLVKERENVSLKEALARVEAVEVLMNPDFKPSAFSAMARNPFSLFGKIFAGIGVLLTCIALLLLYLQQDTISKSDVGEGHVVKMIRSGDTYAPRIEYSWRGQSFVYESSVYSNPPSYVVGEKVELFINRQDPEDIVINTISGRWLAIIIIGGIGVFFFGFGLLFIFVSGKF